MLESTEALRACLINVQNERMLEVKCELSPFLSAKMNDAALVEALVTGLPMAQGIQHRIIRSRGRGTVLTAKIRYRQAVRMLSGDVRTDEEAAALKIAQGIAAQAAGPDANERFRFVYNWICHHICYVHTVPGRKGYERLVGAAGALLDAQANCQGFADVLYLLCGLCGIPCEYRCGRGVRRLHVWNAVYLNGVWQDADASKGARTHDI